MTCDICGPGDKRETRKALVVRQTPFTQCHRLDCGHQWHIELPATGDPRQHRECDCADYKRPSN